MAVLAMLRTHPLSTGDEEVLASCIEACLECSQACTECADACLGEEDVAELRACIALNLDCANVCAVTARVVGRRTYSQPSLTRAVLEACIEACRRCGEECERHAGHHDHCRICAESCRRCERACEDAVSALSF